MITITIIICLWLIVMSISSYHMKKALEVHGKNISNLITDVSSNEKVQDILSRDLIELRKRINEIKDIKKDKLTEENFKQLEAKLELIFKSLDTHTIKIERLETTESEFIEMNKFYKAKIKSYDEERQELFKDLCSEMKILVSEMPRVEQFFNLHKQLLDLSVELGLVKTTVGRIDKTLEDNDIHYKS